VDNHKNLYVEPGDTVVLSSRIIPGNEKAIYRMINHFARRRCEELEAAKARGARAGCRAGASRAT